jgi:hypothetical protein
MFLTPEVPMMWSSAHLATAAVEGDVRALPRRLEIQKGNVQSLRGYVTGT